MTVRSAVIAGIGVVSPLGWGAEATVAAMASGRTGIRPLTLFALPDGNLPLPAGEIDLPESDDCLPRTHRLALAAALQAVAGLKDPPDAVIVGVTTGGMLTTEELLRAGASRPEAFRWHAPGSVSSLVAKHVGCRGPVLTVSTACSSGAVAMALALEMISSGRAERVLAGGADALCRLTYHGFSSLQVVDPAGARPMDLERAGMSVAEGAAFVLLVSRGAAAAGGLAEIRGAGVSCDAYHPATPHPDGEGACAAMRSALAAAGLEAAQVTYVNLHGTGTRENDLAEARALKRVFAHRMPPLASVKGATGHGLAASGAIEAVMSALSVNRGLIPGTPGFRRVDPEIGLAPLKRACCRPVATVLSNSLGFGGNNAALVVAAGGPDTREAVIKARPVLTVLSSACITGAGDLRSTLACLERGAGCIGVLPTEAFGRGLDRRALRRLRRLPRMVLALAAAACRGLAPARQVQAVFFGTGWGALSETYQFLNLLFESGERFSSPTDFIGSVHNAPAGQVALNLGATGANLTMTGGDASFEQALFAAALLAGDKQDPLLVMGADEHHPQLSPRFDPSVAVGGTPADGGGALYLTVDDRARGTVIDPLFLSPAGDGPDPVGRMIDALGGEAALRRDYGAVLAGVPAAMRAAGADPLGRFLEISRFGGPVVDYRRFTGEFATAAAVAAVAAARWTTSGEIPAGLCGGRAARLDGRGILLVGFGDDLTAIALYNRH